MKIIKTMNSNFYEYGVIADIGATNSRMFFVSYYHATNVVKHILNVNYLTGSFTSIHPILEDFLSKEDVKVGCPKFCVLAIAGARTGNVIGQLANMNWSPIDGDEIKNLYKFEFCRVLNDFESAGHSAPFILEQTLPVIFGENGLKNEHLLLIGMGTGLGVCLVTKKNQEWLVSPSEAGHMGMPIVSAKDLDIQTTITKQLNLESHNCFLSQEYLICGKGFTLLYNYLANEKGFEPKENYMEIMAVIKKNQVILNEFTNLYFSYLSRSIVNLTKTFVPNEGCVVIGGIVCKYVREAFNGDFSTLRQHLYNAFTQDNQSMKYNSVISVIVYEKDLAELVIKGAEIFLLKNITESIERAKNKTNFKEKEIQTKVIVETKIPDIVEDSYYRSIRNFQYIDAVKNKVLSFKGFLETGRVGKFFLLGLVMDKGEDKLCNYDKAMRSFKVYNVELVDINIKVAVCLDLPPLFPMDVIEIRDNDKLYYTKELGFYFCLNGHRLIDISDYEFQFIRDHFKPKSLLACSDYYIAKFGSSFYPKPPLRPLENIVNSHVVFFYHDHTREIRSRLTVMKIQAVQETVFLRKNRDIADEFQKCLVHSTKEFFHIYIPLWTKVPKNPFYGYLIMELLYQPGSNKQRIIIFSENMMYMESEELNYFIAKSPKFFDINLIDLDKL